MFFVRTILALLRNSGEVMIFVVEVLEFKDLD